MANQSGAILAETVQVVGLVSAGVGLVDNGNAGVAADGTGNLAIINDKGVAGDAVGVGTVGHSMSGNIHLHRAALAVDKNNTGGTTLHVGNAIFAGNVLALADESIVEVVDGGNLGEGPAGVGAGAKILGHVGRTGQVQSHGVSTGSHQSPGPIDVGFGHGLGIAAGIGVVGLSPDNQLVGSGALLIAVGESVCILATDDAVADHIAPSVVGDVHVLGVGIYLQAAAGRIQQLAVAVQVEVAGLLGIVHSAIDDSGPEIAGAVAVVGGLDVLGSVEAEAVSAGVDAFLQQVKNQILNLLVGGVQIRQTIHAVLGDVKTVGIVAGILVDVMPAAGIVPQLSDDAVGDAGAGVRVTHVVGNNVDNDLDALLVGSFTQALELGLGAQGTVAGIVDVEAHGLVECPPVAEGVLCGGLLGLLNGRGLDGSVAQGNNLIQILFDVLIGPVPAVQGYAVLNAVSDGVTDRSSAGAGGAGNQQNADQKKNGQQPADGAQNMFTHVKTSLILSEKIISNRLQIVQYYFDNVVIWSYN